MSVKYIKVRFNTNDPRDRAALDILKKVIGQNVFIKNAIIAYEEKQQNEQLVETILAAVRSALSNVQLVPPSVPIQNSEVTDEDAAAASADIADAFLDSL
jgi:D-ribose pyranose/furanose isomerase RbsD